MNQKSKLYLFFTSLMFLFSPLSLGLAVIYFNNSFNDLEFQGIFINLGLLFILFLIIVILILTKKLSFPNCEEKKYLLFGLLSNIVIYFYVFQVSLEIEKYITIYLITVLILLLYFIIISKKNINYELWIFGVWFLVIDSLHFNLFTDGSGSGFNGMERVNIYLRLLYFSVPILTLVLYAIKMYKYKVIDIFSSIIVFIALIMSLVIFGVFEVESKFVLTLHLIIPFVIITDFIVSLIYKKFNVKKIPFYLRIYTIILLIFIYQDSNYFFTSNFSQINLIEMILILYVVIISNMIIYLIPKKEIPKDDSFLKELIVEADNEVKRVNEVKKVEEVNEVKETPYTSLSLDLSLLAVLTLRALAKAKGVSGYTSLSKEELIKELKK